MTTKFDPLNPEASQKPPLSTRFVTWTLVIFSIAILIGSVIWGVRLNKPAMPLSAAVAASAPASAASAPADALSEPAAQETADEETFTFDRGDTASGRFGKDAKKFCEYNQIADCNRIQAGVEYKLPEGVTPRALKLAKRDADKAEKLPRKEVKKRVQLTKPRAETSCMRIGAHPFNPDFKLELTLEGIDHLTTLTPEQKAKAKELVRGERPAPKLVTDQVFREMIYKKNNKIVHVYNKKMCTPEEGNTTEAMYMYDLGGGTFFVLPRRCGNPAVIVVPVPPPPPPPPPPPVVEPPVQVQPPVVVPPVEPPVQESPPTVTQAPKPKGMCDHIDPAAALGQEYTLPHDNGAKDDSTFVTASVYCLVRLPSDKGSHGVGAKITASMWDGNTSGDRGQFSGWNVLFGPSYKQILDKGIDWEVSIVGGKQVEEYREGAYASRREFDLAGLTAGLNDYRRRLNGEEWFPEWQVFGALTFPFGKDVSHSYFGKSIADTGDLSRFDFGLQAGFRQWIYESSDWWVHPYFQAGVFVQHPTSASLSLRLGGADPNHIIGFGAGFNCDLKEDCKDFVPAVGWWADPVKGGRVIRDGVRQRQIVSEAAERGVTMERAKNGFIKSIDIGPPPLK